MVVFRVKQNDVTIKENLSWTHALKHMNETRTADKGWKEKKQPYRQKLKDKHRRHKEKLGNKHYGSKD